MSGERPGASGVWGASWSVLERPGASGERPRASGERLGASESVQERPGDVQGASWTVRGASGSVGGTSWSIRGTPWSVRATSWLPPEARAAQGHFELAKGADRQSHLPCRSAPQRRPQNHRSVGLFDKPRFCKKAERNVGWRGGAAGEHWDVPDPTVV